MQMGFLHRSKTGIPRAMACRPVRLTSVRRLWPPVSSRLEQPSVVGFLWLITGCVCEIVGLTVCRGATHLTLLGSCQISAS
jgi:hypothetical protein